MVTDSTSSLPVEHASDRGSTALSRWVVLGIAVAALLAYVALLAAPLPPGARTLWVAFAYLAPSALAAASAAFVLALGVPARERAFWALLLAAMLAFMIGDAYFAWRQTTTLVAGPVDTSDFLLLVGYVALVGAILTWSTLRVRGGRERIGLLLDVVAVSAAVFVVLYGFAIAPAASAGASTALGRVMTALFPIADTVLAGALAIALLGFKRAPWERYQALVAAGAGMLLVGDLTGLLGSAGAAHGVLGQVAQLGGVAWVIGYLAFFLAGCDRLLAEPGELTATVSAPRAPGGLRWPELIAPAAVAVTVPLMMLAAHETTLPSLLVLGAAGAVLGTAVITRTLLGRSENVQLREDATVDGVTGLHNSRYLDEMIADRLRAADIEGGGVTLALIDLAGLDVINEAVGHEAGDDALRELAAIVCRETGGDGDVGRIDGGRFAAVFSGARSFDAYVSCRAIVEQAEHDPALDALVSVSCGLAAYPEHAADRAGLLKAADVAARSAARRGPGRVTSFDPETTQREDDGGSSGGVDALRSLQSLAGAIDGADPDTRSHSANVSMLAAALGARIGLEDAHVERLRVAGTLHDVGKVGVPEDVLRKSEGLSEPEMGAMRSHPELGARMLQATEARELAPWVRAHHERWDGAGYPEGAAGSAIPLAARIIAIADSYDAMTSPRPWREAFSQEYALEQLSAGAGSQFDPELVRAFRELVEQEGDPRAARQRSA